MSVQSANELAKLQPSVSTALEVREDLPSGPSPAAQRVWQLLRRERATMVALVTYASLAGLLTLGVPMAVQALITTVSLGTVLQPLVVLAVALLGVLLAAGALRLLEIRLVESLQRRLFAKAAIDMAAKLATVPLEEAKGRDLRELANRLFDTVGLQNVVVPESARRAVALWVDGNDASLLAPGRHVRLQFEGWPAVQFSGWPSVAVGTFGGVVEFVDATANAHGQFRAVIVPGSEEWPEDRFLRQGVRANGWVLLEQVRLGYEVWRRLNGFPAAVPAPLPADKKSK